MKKNLQNNSKKILTIFFIFIILIIEGLSYFILELRSPVRDYKKIRSYIKDLIYIHFIIISQIPKQHLTGEKKTVILNGNLTPMV